MTEDQLQSIAQRVSADLSAAQSPHNVTLAQANHLIDGVKQAATEMGVRAVIAVSDAAGHPVSVQCMDGAYIASYDIAFQKAFTVVALKMPTTTLKELAQPGGSLYGIQFTNGGRLVIFGGGVPLKTEDGQIIGGLGVSGGSEGQDTALAEYGAAFFAKNRA